MLKLNQTAYILRTWHEVDEVVIFKVKVTGIKIVDEINIMYFVENSRYQGWINDTRVYNNIDEALDNLKGRVVE